MVAIHMIPQLYLNQNLSAFAFYLTIQGGVIFIQCAFEIIMIMGPFLSMSFLNRCVSHVLLTGW